jgi:hypothetical protein
MKDFIIGKARNMRIMLEPFIKTDKHKEIMAKYSENDIEAITLKYLMPLFVTGTLSVAKDTLVTELSIEDDAIKTKIGRYLECFCESLVVKS